MKKVSSAMQFRSFLALVLNMCIAMHAYKYGHLGVSPRIHVCISGKILY